MRRRDLLQGVGLGAAALAGQAVRPALARTKGQAGKSLVFGGSVPLSGARRKLG